MSKEELRELIRNTTDETILKALWELYDLKNSETITKTEFIGYPTITPSNVKPWWEPYYSTTTTTNAKVAIN